MQHSPREIRAMISLLDDTDQGVRDAVWQQMVHEGQEFIEQLSEIDLSGFQPEEFEILERVKGKLNTNHLAQSFTAWKDGPRDLLEGMVLLARYDKPDLTFQEVSNQIEKIKLDAWLEMNYDLTALEKVRILNHIFFSLHGFKGDNNTFLHSRNSFIHRALETKTGNPITLSMIYTMVAQRLGIPIFGVSVPQHFMLAYVDMETDEVPVSNHSMFADKAFGNNDILFYIDPFGQGNLLNKQMVENFVRSLKLDPQDSFYYPCANIDILRRACRNLLNAFAIENRHEKVADVQKLLDALQE